MNNSRLSPYFLGLHIIAQYDLMAGMRGPDSQSLKLLMLKSAITARIRAIVCIGGGIGSSAALYNDTPMTRSELDMLYKDIGMIPDTKEAAHFLSHMRLAVGASMDHPIWGGFGQEIRDYHFLLYTVTQ